MNAGVSKNGCSQVWWAAAAVDDMCGIMTHRHHCPSLPFHVCVCVHVSVLFVTSPPANVAATDADDAVDNGDVYRWMIAYVQSASQ